MWIRHSGVLDKNYSKTFGTNFIKIYRYNFATGCTRHVYYQGNRMIPAIKKYPLYTMSTYYTRYTPKIITITMIII